MPKPDFDQIASRLIADVQRDGVHTEVKDVAEQLRLVWNARGAADLATLQAEPQSSYGPHPPDTDQYVTTSGYAFGLSMKTIDRAIRSSDR